MNAEAMHHINSRLLVVVLLSTTLELLLIKGIGWGIESGVPVTLFLYLSLSSESFGSPPLSFSFEDS